MSPRVARPGSLGDAIGRGGPVEIALVAPGVLDLSWPRPAA